MKTSLRRPRLRLPARLLLVFLATSIVLLVITLALLAHGFGSQWRTNVRPHLTRYLEYVNTDIGNPPDIARAQRLANELPINIYIRGPDTDFSSTGRALSLADIEFESRGGRRANRHRGTKLPDGLAIGEHGNRTVLRNELGEYQIYYELLHQGRRSERSKALLLGLLLIPLVLGTAYLLLRYMLRPVQDISEGVQRMREGELDYQVPVRRRNDLGELAGSINAMATEIKTMLDAKQQLLLGVSHELRSPLTRSKVALELLPESRYRDQITDDLLEMESLITEILETERMNTGHEALHLTDVGLEELTRSVIAEMSLQDVSLHIDDKLPTAQLDEGRIRLLLRNLLSNAVQHGAGAAMAPEVALQHHDDGLLLKVIDHGPGIPTEYLAQITEPFFRVDPSRTRATGGFGLGLYLCKRIAEAHGGSLIIDSNPDNGTCVTVKLPT